MFNMQCETFMIEKNKVKVFSCVGFFFCIQEYCVYDEDKNGTIYFSDIVLLPARAYKEVKKEVPRDVQNSKSGKHNSFWIDLAQL